MQEQSHVRGVLKAVWSEQIHSAKIQDVIRKNQKFTLVFTWALFFVFPVGFLLAGIFLDKMPLTEALLIGFGLGTMMLVIGLIRLKNMKKPAWEGVVTEKSHKQRREQEKGSDDYVTYTEYRVVIKTDKGKKKRIVEKNSNRPMYDYFQVGDRLRYHPALSTYEKYDKTKDEIIFCNVCGLKNAIENDNCTKCNNPLFK